MLHQMIRIREVPIKKETLEDEDDECCEDTKVSQTSWSKSQLKEKESPSGSIKDKLEGLSQELAMAVKGEGENEYSIYDDLQRSIRQALGAIKKEEAEKS